MAPAATSVNDVCRCLNMASVDRVNVMGILALEGPLGEAAEDLSGVTHTSELGSTTPGKGR